MIQTIKDKVVHDIIELWQRPSYRAAAALSLFFFFCWISPLLSRGSKSCPLSSFGAHQPHPPGLQVGKKEKKGKERGSLVCSQFSTHTSSIPHETQTKAHAPRWDCRSPIGTAEIGFQYSATVITVISSTPPPPPNVSAPTSLCNGRKCCLFFAGCVPHLPKTISGYEICGGILRRGGIKCSHAPLGGKRNGGWAQQAGGSLTHPLQCRWQMYRRWKQASSYEAISNI